MTEDRLNRYEELAGKVMSNANDEARLKGLDGLIRKMQNDEPTLFDVVKSCGNWVLRYFEYRQINKATARYYVEAYDSFRAYEADTSEQAGNRMQIMELQREHEYPKYRTVETIKDVGMYEGGTIIYAGIIYVREYDERWQYNRSAPTFGDGYYSYWLCNKGTFLYMLLCALMGKGVGNIAESIRRELLKDYHIVPRNTALEIPADLQEQIDLRNEADKDADRAANELRVAASAAYLWLSILTERGLLQEELAIFTRGTIGEAFVLPQWMQTDRATKILTAMVSQGYIGQTSDGWIWKGSNDKLCAYFAYKCNTELNMSGQKNKYSRARNDWKTFELMFGKTQLCRTYHDNPLQDGYEKIDGIFARN